MSLLFKRIEGGNMPALLNSASPWATTKDELLALYQNSFTAAVSTRTSTLEGFGHDDSIHQYGFFDSRHCRLSSKDALVDAEPSSSLNTLGYSPLPLRTYLDYIRDIVQSSHSNDSTLEDPLKPFVVSVTGSALDMQQCMKQISKCSADLAGYPIYMEINLSCPNIKDKPPPAYSKAALSEYLNSMAVQLSAQGEKLKVGIKAPPYTHADQFLDLREALMASAARGPCPISFITTTNTLGGCLILEPAHSIGASYRPMLNSASGTGIGGMAGASLHPLSLGNVAQIRQIIDSHEVLRNIEIIGVGGVSDVAGALRMKAAGANAVGLASALGRSGLKVFEHIATGSG